MALHDDDSGKHNDNFGAEFITGSNSAFTHHRFNSKQKASKPSTKKKVMLSHWDTKKVPHKRNSFSSRRSSLRLSSSGPAKISGGMLKSLNSGGRIGRFGLGKNVTFELTLDAKKCLNTMDDTQKILEQLNFHDATQAVSDSRTKPKAARKVAMSYWDIKMANNASIAAPTEEKNLHLTDPSYPISKTNCGTRKDFQLSSPTSKTNSASREDSQQSSEIQSKTPNQNNLNHNFFATLAKDITPSSRSVRRVSFEKIKPLPKSSHRTVSKKSCSKDSKIAVGLERSLRRRGGLRRNGGIGMKNNDTDDIREVSETESTQKTRGLRRRGGMRRNGGIGIQNNDTEDNGEVNETESARKPKDSKIAHGLKRGLRRRGGMRRNGGIGMQNNDAKDNAKEVDVLDSARRMFNRLNFKQPTIHVATAAAPNNAILSYWDTKKLLNEKSNGDIEFRKCPSMSEKQQCIAEYSLPLILPAMFYLQNLSLFGLHWCMVIVVGHSLETTLTNFGPSVKHFRMLGWIPPLVHHLIDCFWLHSLISAILWMPHRFVSASVSAGSMDDDDGSWRWGVIYMAMLLIQTLPIYLAVSFKTDYLKHRPPATSDNDDDNDDDKYRKRKPSTSKIGMHIRRCFVWYWASTVLVFTASFLGSCMLLKVGVLCLNATPLVLFCAYSNVVTRPSSERVYIESK